MIYVTVEAQNPAGYNTRSSPRVGPITENENDPAAIATASLEERLPPNIAVQTLDQQPSSTGSVLVGLQYLVDGVPLFGAQAVVAVRGDQVVMTNGEPPQLEIGTTPAIPSQQATDVALTTTADLTGLAVDGLTGGAPHLTILDPGRLGLDFPTQATLTWLVRVTLPDGTSWAIFVSAVDGSIAWFYEESSNGLSRRVCDEEWPCVNPVRTEGAGATGNSLVDQVYDSFGDAYNYFADAHGRDSFDGDGGPVVATVSVGYRNAASHDNDTFKIGGAFSSDDIVAHEFTHAVNRHSVAGGLARTVESGAIDEGLSDFFGELVDLRNGRGNDAESVRWVMGEDSTALRNLKDPSQSQEATASRVGDASWLWTGANPYANMGVLTRFGAILSDGEGDVRGIGTEKAASIIFAAAQSLTYTASFGELARQLQWACSELATSAVSAEDCQQVDRALREVNMAIDPPANPYNARGYIARDPNSGRAVLVGTDGRVTSIISGQQFNCLAESRIVWDISNLRALVEPVDGVQLSCFDAGPHWSTSPPAQGGNVGSNVILRDSDSPAHNWLINTQGEIQTILDGGTYLCLARSNPVIWNVSGQSIESWQPVGTSPAPCGSASFSSCAELTVVPNDDRSSDLIELPMTVNFGGREFASLWVNNNGNVTFDGPMSTYTPFDLRTSSRAIVAPFFADVDTRPAGTSPATAGRTTYQGHRAFCANWENVGYYNGGTDKLNSFQLILADRSDVGQGAFDIVFNYTNIEWETGSASGGSGGHGGRSATVGFSNGRGFAQELSGSRVPGSFLNTGPLALVADSNVGTPGRFVWEVR